MKNKSILSLVLVFMVSISFTSCKDMLSPDMERYSEDFAKDSVYSAFGIAMSIQKIAERSVLLDELRSDLVTTGTYTNDSVANIANFIDTENRTNKFLNIADYYHLINSCNFYFAKVDTAATENTKSLMKKEYAQIKTIRAWAYLQLVRLYGEVPYVTKAVSSNEEAETEQQNAKKINKDNIAELLANDLIEAYAIQRAEGIPNYGTIKIGDGEMSSKNLFFPTELVLADVYLTANQYDSAAQYYYEYFLYGSNGSGVVKYGNNTYLTGSSVTTIDNIERKYLHSGNILNAFNKNAIGDEIITASPIADNSANGTVMTDVQHIFGFSTEGSGSSIKVTPSRQYQQIAPSQYYITLNQSQTYNLNRKGATADQDLKYSISGDGRLCAYAPRVSFSDGTEERIIDKFAPNKSQAIEGDLGGRSFSSSFEMLYAIPLYRMPLVQLRYAEAINRAGFPQIAFGVLKDGLYAASLPTIKIQDDNIYYGRRRYIDDVAVRDSAVLIAKASEDPEKVEYDTIFYKLADTLVTEYIGVYPDASKFNVPHLVAPKSFTEGMYYVDLDQMLKAQDKPYLDFSPEVFNEKTVETSPYAGVHGRGCGDCGGRLDTVYTYAKQVAKKVAEKWAVDNSKSYAEQLAYEETLSRNDTLLVTDEEAIIDAVENIIVDELALETGFEGHRFSDLLRIKDHKGGSVGTQWFARKIGRRYLPVDANATEVDATLYEKMLEEENWYLQKPE